MATNFDIDFDKLGKRILPHFLRQTRNLDFVQSGLKGVNDVNDNLISTRDTLKLKLSFSAQVISLEKWLNDNFDPVLRQIFISHPASVNEPTYLFNKAENATPFYVFNDVEVSVPIYFYNVSEIGSEFDYFINIPTTVTFDTDELRAGVDVYNVAGKNYDIILF